MNLIIYRRPLYKRFTNAPSIFPLHFKPVTFNFIYPLLNFIIIACALLCQLLSLVIGIKVGRSKKKFKNCDYEEKIVMCTTYQDAIFLLKIKQTCIMLTQLTCECLPEKSKLTYIYISTATKTSNLIEQEQEVPNCSHRIPKRDFS